MKADILNEVRESVARSAGGKFAKGNKNATGRRSVRREKTECFRDTIASTKPETFRKIWARVLYLAKGDIENGIEPEQWAVKLVVEQLVGNRVAVEQQEKIDELELIVEHWLGNNGTTGTFGPTERPMETPDAGDAAPAEQPSDDGACPDTRD